MTATLNSSSPTLAGDVQVAMILGGDRGEWAMVANLALLRFLSGEEPYLRKFQAHGVTDPEMVLPDESATTRHIHTPAASCVLLVGEAWTATITAHASGDVFVQVTASSCELAQTICKQVASKVPASPTPRDCVPMTFWHHTGGGARQELREIEAPAWEEIRANYPADARRDLDRLMDLAPSPTGGRLVLLHGEPGTGKSTALRALARVWAPWCRTDYVVDSDRLFATPSYLLGVITARHISTPGAVVEARPWRLLIIEDCDELIRADAKNASGQALSRLLNVTDGMVGQGLKVLICITTNEEVHRLHPAVIRPGRCLANIDVSRFGPAEAAAWLGSTGVAPADGATLAELFAIRANGAPVSTRTLAG